MIFFLIHLKEIKAVVQWTHVNRIIKKKPYNLMLNTYLFIWNLKARKDWTVMLFWEKKVAFSQHAADILCMETGQHGG